MPPSRSTVPDPTKRRASVRRSSSGKRDGLTRARSPEGGTRGSPRRSPSSLRRRDGGQLEHGGHRPSRHRARRRAAQPALAGEEAQLTAGEEADANALQAPHGPIADADRGHRRGGDDRAPSRCEVSPDRAQSHAGIVEEIENAAADDEVEGAPEVEGLQRRMHADVQGRPGQLEHRGGSVHTADGGDSRPEQRGDLARAAADVEHGVRRPGRRELDDGVALAIQDELAQAVRTAARIPARCPAVEPRSPADVARQGVAPRTDWESPRSAAWDACRRLSIRSVPLCATGADPLYRRRWPPETGSTNSRAPTRRSTRRTSPRAESRPRTSRRTSSR